MSTYISQTSLICFYDKLLHIRNSDRVDIFISKLVLVYQSRTCVEVSSERFSLYFRIADYGEVDAGVRPIFVSFVIAKTVCLC